MVKFVLAGMVKVKVVSIQRDECIQLVILLGELGSRAKVA